MYSSIISTFACKQTAYLVGGSTVELSELAGGPTAHLDAQNDAAPFCMARLTNVEQEKYVRCCQPSRLCGAGPEWTYDEILHVCGVPGIMLEVALTPGQALMWCRGNA